MVPEDVGELEQRAPDRAISLAPAQRRASLAYLPAFLATLASRDLRPPADPPARSRPRLPWTLIAVVGVVEAARMAGEVGTYAFFNVHLDRLAVAPIAIGAVVATGFAAAGVAALLAPTLTRRWGARPTIAGCLVAMAGAIALLAVPAPSAAFVGYVATVALAAVGMAALSAYRMELVAPVAWSAMAGVAVTGQGLGESLVLLAGGVTIEAFGFTPYYLGVAALVLGGALFVALRLRPDRA